MPGGLSSATSVPIAVFLATLRLARFWRIANIPARIRACWRLARRSRAENPLAAEETSISPLRASTVEPIGIAATPLSGMNPVSCLKPRPAGSLTNTSPESWRTTAVTPAVGGVLPDGSSSQASPTPSLSPSDWSVLASAGQLSLVSGSPSLSLSGTGGAGTVKPAVAGVGSRRP